MKNIILSYLVICISMSAGVAEADVVEGFDGGENGGFTGTAFFEPTGGNPDGNARLLFAGFFAVLRTGGIGEASNDNFLGDFSSFDQVTFGLDVRVDMLTNFFLNDITRDIGIALIDRDIQGPGNSPSGVFFSLGGLSSAAQPDWTNLSVTIDDLTSSTLPAGWVGFGDQDPDTSEPILPDGATFASVLAGVDEFQITGAVPGFLFTNANYDVRIDNVSVTTTPVPEPTGACLLLLAIGVCFGSRRNKNIIHVPVSAGASTSRISR